MTTEENAGLKFMKYWPIVLFLILQTIGGIKAWYDVSYRVKMNETEMKKLETRVDNISSGKEIADLRREAQNYGLEIARLTTATSALEKTVSRLETTVVQMNTFLLNRGRFRDND